MDLIEDPYPVLLIVGMRFAVTLKLPPHSDFECLDAVCTVSAHCPNSIADVELAPTYQNTSYNCKEFRKNLFILYVYAESLFNLPFSFP